MSTFFALIKALPEIMAFLSWLQKTITDLQLQHDVKSGTALIHQTFASKDPDELKKIFAGP